MISLLLTAAAAAAGQPVTATYLDTDPQIDGNLSAAEAALPAQQFRVENRLDNPDVPVPEIRFRLGYTPDHLYLAISHDGDAVSYHNRGYLWGDGWRIILTDAPDGRSGNFVEIYGDPRPEGDDGAEAFLAVQNGDQVYRRFRGDSRVAEAAGPDGTVFEALIDWGDIRPFRAGFDDIAGINLMFAKGLQTEEAGYFPYVYKLVHDDGVWDEEMLDRASVPLSFGAAPAAQRVRPALRTLATGQSLTLDWALYGDADPAPVRVELLDENGAPIQASTIAPEAPVFDLSGRSAGTYSLAISGADWSDEGPLVILPEIDLTVASMELAVLEGESDQGTFDTLSFRFEELRRAIGSIAPYEAADDLGARWTAFENALATATAGDDPFANVNAPYRRAFRSALDDSLQPYSVHVPEGASTGGARPAILFLHGSGTDDQGLLDRRRGDGRMVEIAPCGRDKYRAYAMAESQVDIIEALDAATRDFDLDPERIVIGGFSMGGYGALRAFYAHPHRYAGVAIFAGHPNLAQEWLGVPQPNFLIPEYLKVFEGVPVFIYHGTADAALAYGEAKKLAEALEEAGAIVTFRGVEGRGHTYQDEETQALFEAWLEQFHAP
ncbi:alpha/beta hydrolase-fold protein [Sphingomicrobium sediminis]|uniref:Prolyl oligopeptidase family serine peptidase n=1 Tax=Sphingomicrobium sediminis TaxID=2950949 RepID=A0A9X2EFD1_9SPHN|nr:alpha/beta hydrolase-fold protein [Sphingomicrobium sediminis]MCM8556535.1 prolyl oligopeptidase family serine peptidase [Sphingomicrobium sediminis]